MSQTPDSPTIESPEQTVPSRRRVIHLAAAAAAGAVGAAALGQQASAANGQPVLLGQDNSATLPTRISNDGPFNDLSGPGPVALELESPGGHLRFIGTPGDTVLGTYPEGTLAYNASSGLEIWQITATTPKPTLLARPGTAGAFTLLSPPERVYDSRPGVPPDGPNDGVLANGQTRTIDLLASGSEQLRENIDGVLLNVTVTQTTGAGFLSVFSAELTDVPAISNINWTAAGTTIANMTVTATEFAQIKVHCGGTGSTHVIVDVIGMYG